MKNFAVLILIILVFSVISGCRSINVGGSGEIGGVYGGGGVSIPIPKSK